MCNRKLSTIIIEFFLSFQIFKIRHFIVWSGGDEDWGYFRSDIFTSINFIEGDFAAENFATVNFGTSNFTARPFSHGNFRRTKFHCMAFSINKLYWFKNEIAIIIMMAFAKKNTLLYIHIHTNLGRHSVRFAPIVIKKIKYKLYRKQILIICGKPLL